jgi:hypothetical protein
MGRKSRLKRERKQNGGDRVQRAGTDSIRSISRDEAIARVTGGSDLEPFTAALERELVDLRGWRATDIADLRAMGAMYHRERNSAILPQEFSDAEDLQYLEDLDDLDDLDDLRG